MVSVLQQTFIDGSQSDFCNVICGIPQGFILGPLLFTITLTFLPHAIYADDTTLTSSTEDSLTQNESAVK